MNRTKRKNQKHDAKLQRKMLNVMPLNFRTVTTHKDEGPDTFTWHWPRGTFEPRMSALEIAAFILPYMPGIVPMLADRPRIQAEFLKFIDRLTNWRPSVLDELHSWIKPVLGGPDDLIEMSLYDHTPQPSAPKVFAPMGVLWP